MDEQLAWHAGTGLPQVYVAAVEEIAAYFDGKPGVDALLLIASFARGKGDLALGSDCDLVLLHNVRFAATAELPAYEAWFAERNREWQLDQYGRYSGIDLELHNGRFAPKPRGWTSGPDDFELEIGNTLVYSRPIRRWTDRFQRLRTPMAALLQRQAASAAPGRRAEVRPQRPRPHPALRRARPLLPVPEAPAPCGRGDAPGTLHRRAHLSHRLRQVGRGAGE